MTVRRRGAEVMVLPNIQVDELLLYPVPTPLGDAARGMFPWPELTDLAGRQELRIIDLRGVGDDLRLLARLK